MKLKNSSSQKKSQVPDIIRIEDITKDYIAGEVVTNILRGVSITIKKGEFVAITGPSGSGKSTLMNMIGLLDTPTTGKYIFDGEDVTHFSENELAYIRNRKIGFVFQSFNLLSRASALENVILPSIYAGIGRSDRTARGIELLEKIGLSERIHNRPNQLSGGQQQRVAIARALMNNPEMILADEPTGNLDSKSGEDVMKILHDLHKTGRTIVVITHEAEIAKNAERVIHIKDGKVV